MTLHTKVTQLRHKCIEMLNAADVNFLNTKLELMQAEIDLLNENLQRQVPPFDIIKVKCEKLIDDSSVPIPVRIFASMVLSNMDVEIGILRCSDLCETYSIDHHNWLDFATATWHIRKDYTKNRNERSFQVSWQFIVRVESIYGYIPEKIINIDAAKLNVMINKYFDYNFNIIRAAYFTHRYYSCQNRSDLLKLCYNQGHSYETAVMNYLRVIAS